ncbi:MAG: hypothetical protein H7099_14695 [Gemmatimonadaceae bacterium]|nr:hypothetical protein [Gemmatimonadaceae bacterium]
MTFRGSQRWLWTMLLAAVVPSVIMAQDATTARERIRARREARRDANAAQSPDERNRALAERQRVENALREALAQAVKQRLNLNDQQASRLMDVNRRFSEDRIRIARDEIRIRRELRQSINGRDSSRSPETARLLDELLDAQRQRLDLQQKEQTALSEFLTPEQRARYIAMMEQLRRRIQLRADSARSSGDPPDA